MALPVGVTSATCTVGVPVSFTGAANIRANVSVKPSVFLVHAATGTPLVDMLEAIDTTDGVAGQFTLPHTDQAGFVDENQNVYTNWFYTVTIQYSNDRQVMLPKTKVFQLTTGQTLVDLDRLPSGVLALPYTAPAATVTSVVGLTGPVTGAQIAADPALSATFVPKWKPTTAYIAGDKVLNPSGDIVSAKVGFTSGASYNAANWNLSPTFGRPLITTPSPFLPTTNALASRQIKGYDTVDNVAWYVNSTDMVTSADHGVTMGANRTLPTNVTAVNVVKVLRAGGYVWLGAKDTTDNITKVWRAPVTAGAYTWSGPLVSMTALGGLLQSSMSADGQYVYLGDYADPTGGAKVYRGDVATGTFTDVTPTGIIRHVHAIEPDPYNAGHVWMTTGDSGARTYRSTNYGQTWTLIDSLWQSVQISFSPEWVFFAADSAVCSVFVMNRMDLIPLAATPSFHYEMPVPAGAASRPVNDLQTTNASKVVTSATAAFTAADVGKQITHTASPSNNYIASYQSATQVTLSGTSWATGTKTGVIEGDRFYDKAFWGAVDPASGVYYCIANDNSGKGNRSGLFMLRKVGEPLVLVETFPTQITGQMFIAGGYVHSHQVVRPSLALA